MMIVFLVFCSFRPLCRRQSVSLHYVRNAATHCNTLQHTAACCNMLQLTAIHCNKVVTLDDNRLPHLLLLGPSAGVNLFHYVRNAATHCNTLQHAATCCNTLQHAATRCNTLQYNATNW